jgi:glycosyltransferase involved in cell wall biosynthesis
VNPLVSAIIPTRNRPEIVCRAVRSVLAQTYTNLEVIVVVDGPDPATVSALEALHTSQLRIIALDSNVGGSEARNIGIRASRGKWVALLDDDDEWLPLKIEQQVRQALEVDCALVFVGCQFIARDRFGDRIRPHKAYDPARSFSDYLFCRDSLRVGTGYMQTSTWLISSPLAKAVPFTPGLKRNQDSDWMLHAMAVPGAQFRLVSEPLTIFHSEEEIGRISKKPDWMFQYTWGVSNRAYFSNDAFAFFLCTICAEDAAKQKKRLTALVQILRVICHDKSFSLRCLFCLFYYLCIPECVGKGLGVWRQRHSRRQEKAI